MLRPLRRASFTPNRRNKPKNLKNTKAAIIQVTIESEMKQKGKDLVIHYLIVPYRLIKLSVLLQELHTLGPNYSMMALAMQDLDQQLHIMTLYEVSTQQYDVMVGWKKNTFHLDIYLVNDIIFKHFV